ncbi:unnamed protein product, partial [Darwinula stevensoni]
PSLPAVALPTSEGRNHLWKNTREAVRYIYKHHRDDADWFLKADDDTYVIMENLRYMLIKHDPREPVYFGCRFKFPLAHTQGGYMSGGPGYVMSREAVERFVEKALPNPALCPPLQKDEDVGMGKCMHAVGVEAGDSRDELGRWRFLPFEPEFHINPDNRKGYKWKWFSCHSYYSFSEGLQCCSDTVISFHYISPEQMHILEYLIYHVHPYGL